MTLRNRITTLVGLALTATLMASVAIADDSRPPPRGQPPEPPPEAFSACSSKANGDTCTVSFERGTIHGTCALFTDQRVFCRPEGMPPPPPRE